MKYKLAKPGKHQVEKVWAQSTNPRGDGGIAVTKASGQSPLCIGGGCEVNQHTHPTI